MAKKEMTRETLLEEISKWQEENEKNRAAFVVLCERENEEDLGNSASALLGQGCLIVNSIGTVASKNPEIGRLIATAVMPTVNPLAALAEMLGEDSNDSNVN